MSSWWTQNPEYEYTFFNDSAAANFVRDYGSADERRAYRSLRVGAQRADLFRLLYLREMGGVYADLDQELGSPLRSWIPADASAVVGRYWPYELLIFAPQHPIMVATAKSAVANVNRQLDLHLRNSTERCTSPHTCVLTQTGPAILQIAAREAAVAEGCDKPRSAGLEPKRDCHAGASAVMRSVHYCAEFGKNTFPAWTFCGASRHWDCRFYAGNSTSRFSQPRPWRCGKNHWQSRSRHAADFFDLDAAAAPEAPLEHADDSGRRGAYAFTLFGACPEATQLSLLASIALLRATAPTFPIVVLATPGCGAARLPKLHALLATLGATTTEPREAVGPVRCSGNFWGEGYNTSYEKYAIWAAEKYDALLYLDTDLAVLKNMDHVIRDLLAMPEMNAHALTPDGCGGNVRHAFNTGVWGVRPNRTLYRTLVNYLRGTRIPCQLGEQTASMAFFRDWTPRRRQKLGTMGVGELHYGYNAIPAHGPIGSCLRRAGLPESALHVVHWAGNSKRRDRAAAKNRWPGDDLERSALARFEAEACRWQPQLLGTSCSEAGGCQVGWVRGVE